MSSEPDDEVAWLLAREQGQPLPRVSAATASRHAELESLISELPATPIDPPPGWQEQMLAAIQAAPSDRGARGTAAVNDVVVPAARRGRLRGALTAVVGAAAGVLAVVVWVRTTGAGEQPTGPLVTVSVEPGPLNRSVDRGVGDTLLVRAVLQGKDGELRVYDTAGVEQRSCTAPGPGCSVEREGRRTTLTLRFEVPAKSAFRAILFSPPLATPSAGLDNDVAFALRAGLGMTVHEPVSFGN